MRDNRLTARTKELDKRQIERPLREIIDNRLIGSEERDSWEEMGQIID